MPSIRTTRSRTTAATVLVVGGLLAAPAAALAHGGAEIAQGDREGVSVVVQGAELEDGRAGVHMSANVTGDAAPDPDEVDVRFVLRDPDGEVFTRRAGSDGTSIHDVDVRQGDHGAWEEWDVSALVGLADGRTVRVTNAPDDPPKVEPAADEQEADGASASAGGGSTTAAAAPTAAAQPVDATTSADDGAPAWVLPSGIAIVLLALGGVVLVRRRRAAG